MHSWNLTNLDVEAKATLETLLRPNYLGVIPRWLVNSKTDQKKKLVKLGRQLDFKNRGILDVEQMRPDESLKCRLAVRRNEPIRRNNKGHELHKSHPQQSLDRCSTKAFDGVHLLARSYSAPAARQPGLGGANNGHTLFTSGGELQKYFLLGNEPLHRQGIAKMLDPKITRRMEELVLGHTTDAEKAQILASLQDLEKSFKSVPPYLEFKGAMASMGGPPPRPGTAPSRATRDAAEPQAQPPSRPGTPTREARPPSRPGTPTHVPNRRAPEELYAFSQVMEQKFPSQMAYETCCLPPEPPMPEPRPPPPPKELRKDQQSQVYFPGNPTDNQKTTYQESFQDRACAREWNRKRKARPSSAVALGQPPSTPTMQSRPSTATGARGERQYFGTTLSPRMFDALRKRPASVGRQG